MTTTIYLPSGESQEFTGHIGPSGGGWFLHPFRITDRQFVLRHEGNWHLGSIINTEQVGETDTYRHAFLLEKIERQSYTGKAGEGPRIRLGGRAILLTRDDAGRPGTVAAFHEDGEQCWYDVKMERTFEVVQVAPDALYSNDFVITYIGGPCTTPRTVEAV